MAFFSRKRGDSIRLQSEVIPDGITLSGYDFGRGLCTHDTEPEITAVISLNGHSLDSAFVWAVRYILIVFAEDSDVVPIMEFVPRLFQCERRVILSLAEMRDTVPTAALFLLGVKERLVGTLYALGYILNRLRTKFTPVLLIRALTHLCKMHFELICG